MTHFPFDSDAGLLCFSLWYVEKDAPTIVYEAEGIEQADHLPGPGAYETQKKFTIEEKLEQTAGRKSSMFFVTKRHTSHDRHVRRRNDIKGGAP